MNNSNLSIYAQLPQHITIGIAQMFGLLAGLEFAYFVAPRSAQSLFMSFHFISRIITGYIPMIYRTFYEIDFNVSIVMR